jgi:hypothetical protein
MNNHYYSFFHTNNFFADKVPYTVEVDWVLRTLAAETKRNAIFVVAQDRALASFFVQKANMSAVGFFTYTPEKHSYSFLVPIFIDSFFMKTAMYSYMYSSWGSGNNMSLLNHFKFIVNYKLFKELKLVKN